jgi:hypothetical protein
MALGADFAQASYKQASSNAFQSAEMNPWNTVLGAASGAATSALTGGFGSMMGGGKFGAGASNALGGAWA